MLVPFYVTCKIPVLFWRPFLSAKMAYISYELTGQKNCGAWLKYWKLADDCVLEFSF